MTVQSGNFAITLPLTSKARGARLHGHRWMPDAAPKSVILLAHGLYEHLARYAHVAAHLTARGHAVYAIDHWGHGRSDGTRGFVPAFSVYADGMEGLLRHVEVEHPGVPLFLLGHSMGGLMAADHLLTHQALYRGAVFSGPAFQPTKPPPRLTVWIGRFLSWIAPRVGVIALDSSAVSRDPAVVADYLADPLVHKGKIGARLGAEMLATMVHVQAHAGQIHLPLLVLHGEADRLAGVSGSRQFVASVGSADKGIKTYPGLFHEIFNEPEQADVLNDASTWLGAHLPN